MGDVLQKLSAAIARACVRLGLTGGVGNGAPGAGPALPGKALLQLDQGHVALILLNPLENLVDHGLDSGISLRRAGE